MPPDTRRDRRPELAILASTFLWGTLWYPLRRLDAAGGGGAWVTIAAFALPLGFFLPLVLRRRRELVAAGGSLITGAGLTAGAVALYTEALIRGDVVPSMLLFYLTPVWSTLLARVMLGEPITGRRVATILFGLTGMAVVLGRAVPIPGTVAEWMALASGACWGLAMVHVHRTTHSSALDQTGVQFLFLPLAVALLSLVPGGRAWTLPATAVWIASAGWMIAFGTLWMSAVIWLTLFGAHRVEPGRVAILLMLEVVIGLVSAGSFAGEAISAQELVGAALIIGAGALELVPGASRKLGPPARPSS